MFSGSNEKEGEKERERERKIFSSPTKHKGHYNLRNLSICPSKYDSSARLEMPDQHIDVPIAKLELNVLSMFRKVSDSTFNKLFNKVFSRAFNRVFERVFRRTFGES